MGQMTTAEKIQGLKKVIKILDDKRSRVAGLGSSRFILNEILTALQTEEEEIKKFRQGFAYKKPAGLRTPNGFGIWYDTETTKAKKMFTKSKTKSK